jgi:hypothetical protein
MNDVGHGTTGRTVVVSCPVDDEGDPGLFAGELVVGAPDAPLAVEQAEVATMTTASAPHATADRLTARA